MVCGCLNNKLCDKTINIICCNEYSFTTEAYYDDSEKPIELGEGDYIQFAVKTKSNPNKYLIRKILTKDDYDTNKNLVVKLNPSDTNLDVFNGYVYDCSIGFADGTFYTYLQGNLNILPSVGKPIEIDPLIVDVPNIDETKTDIPSESDGEVLNG